MKQRELTSRAIILAGGEWRKTEIWMAILYAWIKLFYATRTTIFQVRVTCCHCSVNVIADSRCQFDRILKVVDICSWELCCDVAVGAPKDRVDKVFLLEEHTPVVRAFPSVVEWEDAGVLPASKVRP